MFGTGRMGTIKRKAATACAVAAVASMAAVMSTAGPAFADSIQTFQNENTANCLDGNSVVGPAYVDRCGTQEISEDWNVHYWADGTRELQTIDTGNNPAGYCLDDSDAYGLRTYYCNKSTFQSWWVTNNSDGSVSFKNQATGRCIDDSAAYGLRTFACNGLDFQSWR